MNKIIIVTLISSITFLCSCNKAKPDPGATASVNMADEWWVKQSLNGTLISGAVPKHFYTYNTAANDNTMWFDDRGTLGATKRFKAITIADYSALTFSASSSDNIGMAAVAGVYPKVTITDGKIMKGVGHSKTGNITDSIYFNVSYSNDPGNTYTITGHARTFFIDDDY